MFDDRQHVIGLPVLMLGGLRCKLNSAVHAKTIDLYRFESPGNVITYVLCGLMHFVRLV